MGAHVIAATLYLVGTLGVSLVILKVARERGAAPRYTREQVRAALEASGFSAADADMVLATLEQPRRLRP